MSAAVHNGDCRSVLPTFAPNSIDACVTDPPYELGFMGKAWDRTGVANDASMWREVLRVLKPGAHLVAFSGTRTYHRMVCAIEDAGFEIRDQIGWAYGSGFPKSHNLDGKWDGWGTALKPAWEPIVVARKPLSEKTVSANVLRWGTGAINVDGCRVETTDDSNRARPPRTPNAILGGGKGTNLTASPHNDAGRWPANLIHDGSQGVLELFPESTSGAMKAGTRRAAQDGPGSVCYGTYGGDATKAEIVASTGSAARFFYCAKASKTDRAGSNHPTVKPRALMRYLCRLVTPPGGTVLDPFAGSGSTLYAAREEGFGSVGIEMESEYAAHIGARLATSPHTATALEIGR